jgi:hypothetical protein
MPEYVVGQRVRVKDVASLGMARCLAGRSGVTVRLLRKSLWYVNVEGYGVVNLYADEFEPIPEEVNHA